MAKVPLLFLQDFAFETVIDAFKFCAHVEELNAVDCGGVKSGPVWTVERAC
jgi:hypothetical protein